MADVSAPRLSVIVPVYNVGAFLDQCLASILSQTFRDIEIVCLNDGSTDDSLAIMRRFEALDARMRVIDKANEGYGATCNRGIDAARGEYVAIVEPDDYLLPTMYEELLAFADSFEEPVDVVKEAWFDVIGWDDPTTERIVPGYLYKRLKTSKRPRTIADMPVLLEGHPSIWSALYRKAFLDEREIRFNAYPGAGWADNPFLIDTLVQAKRIAYLDAMHYCYRNELPRPAGAAVDEGRLIMPLVRWKDMTQALRVYGATDRGVWYAHYQRGFNYIDDVVAAGGGSELIEGVIRDVLSMMEESVVLDHPKLSPAKKAFYFDEIGKAVPQGISRMPYMRHLVHELLVCVKAQGVGGALSALGGFLRRKSSAENAETVE